MLNEEERKHEQQKLLWAAAELTRMCAEKANTILQENQNTSERIKNLFLILNDGISKMSRIQEPTYECATPIYDQYSKQVNKI